MRSTFFARVRRVVSLRRWLRMPVIFGTVVALIVGLGAGTAFAFFTSSGNGSGTVSVGITQSVTVVEATGTAVNMLYPGTSGDLLVKLDNPNGFSVTIVSITGNGTVTVAGGSGTCNTTGVTVPTQTGLSMVVAASSTVSVVIPDGVSMDATSDSGCQGATFQVPVSLTVRK